MPQLTSIDDLLEQMVQIGASDLHITVGSPPAFRVRGHIQRAEGFEPFDADDTRSTLYRILSSEQQKHFELNRQLDFAYSMPGLARFRVNVYFQREAVGAAFRLIPQEIKTLEELSLPPVLHQLAEYPRGLVLVTGPTGSGKSTTLAAVIDEINRTRSEHILTVEDPIEFLHQHRMCLVNQREVGFDTPSFAEALRAALRQDPDVILVGEMRDLETIAIAIETAETGHLVFGTLHTTTAVSTVDRIVDQFPPDRQAQIRVMLSESLKGVIAQVLCKKTGGGRVAAHEILLGTSAVAALVRDGKTFQLPSVMQTSKAAGMVTMNDSLMTLVQKKLVDPKEAYIKSVDKSGLLAMFKSANLPTSFT